MLERVQACPHIIHDSKATVSFEGDSICRTRRRRFRRASLPALISMLSSRRSAHHPRAQRCPTPPPPEGWTCVCVYRWRHSGSFLQRSIFGRYTVKEVGARRLILWPEVFLACSLLACALSMNRHLWFLVGFSFSRALQSEV